MLDDLTISPFHFFIHELLLNRGRYAPYALLSNQIMHIGIDLRTLLSPHKTGIGEYTTELLTAIFAHDTKNEYYLFYNSFQKNTPHIPLWQQPNVHYITTHWPNKIFNGRSFLTQTPKLDHLIEKKLNKTQPTTSYNLPASSYILDAFFSPHLNFTTLSPGVTSILTIHDLSFEFFPEFFSFKQRLWHRLIKPKEQCARANLILTPSENTKRDLLNFYHLSPKKIHVLAPGLSSNFIFPTNENSIQQKKEADQKILKKYNVPKKFILFLGTIEPRKNICGMIDAFERFHHETKEEFELVIAGGTGWNNSLLHKLIASSPARKYIRLLGYVEENDKPALYRASSLFVYPSFYEGFGFPVLEAMASGTPVITSNRSSLPEITGSAAYLINPHRPEEIAKGMNLLLHNPQLHQTFVKNGQKRAMEYRWAKTALEWIHLVEAQKR